MTGLANRLRDELEAQRLEAQGHLGVHQRTGMDREHAHDPQTVRCPRVDAKSDQYLRTYPRCGDRVEGRRCRISATTRSGGASASTVIASRGSSSVWYWVGSSSGGMKWSVRVANRLKATAKGARKYTTGTRSGSMRNRIR